MTDSYCGVKYWKYDWFILWCQVLEVWLIHFVVSSIGSMTDSYSFYIFFRNTASHQTCHKWYCRVLEEVLYFLWEIQNWAWSPRFLIGWDIFNFFSITFACEVARFARNVPIGITKKLLFVTIYFEIQDGCPGLWLAVNFSTCSLELLNSKSIDLPEIFLCRFLRSGVTFSEIFEI
jgi:hypothetical protein